MSVVPSRSIAGCIERRIASSRSPSARSCVDATVPPAARRVAAIASASASAAGPSVWIVSCAAPGVGRVEAQQVVDGARDAASISSMIDGWTPDAVTAADAAAAARTSGKVAATVHTVAGDEPAELQGRADDDAERALGPDDE